MRDVEDRETWDPETEDPEPLEPWDDPEYLERQRQDQYRRYVENERWLRRHYRR